MELQSTPIKTSILVGWVNGIGTIKRVWSIGLVPQWQCKYLETWRLDACLFPVCSDFYLGDFCNVQTNIWRFVQTNSFKSSNKLFNSVIWLRIYAWMQRIRQMKKWKARIKQNSNVCFLCFRTPSVPCYWKQAVVRSVKELYLR